MTRGSSLRTESQAEAGKKNLKKARGFQKGQSGNPKGRPKGIKYISEIQRRMMPQLVERDPEKLLAEYDFTKHTWAEYLALCNMVMATEKPEAMKVLQDRIEGKVPEPIEVSGTNGQPLKVTITYTVVDGRTNA